VRERLGALPLFADLDDAQLERLAAATTEFEAPAGRTLIERGQAGAGMFVLEQGTILVEAPEGERELGPGTAFGERALVGGDGLRSARVRAKTDVSCLAIARSAIDEVVRANPALAERLGHLRSD
jgi:CRP-like cAMP-binding protein